MASSEMRSRSSYEAKVPPRTNRSFENYAGKFGYTHNEHKLADKKILDIGSGDSSFSEGAEKYGATVLSVDFGYLKNPPTDKKNAIAAIAQELPFADESFDEVISLWCVSPWIKTGVDETLREMMRITKKGGVVRINPVRRPELDDPLYADANSRIASAVTFPQEGEVTIEVTKLPDFTEEQVEELVETVTRIVGGKRKQGSSLEKEHDSSRKKLIEELKVIQSRQSSSVSLAKE